MTNPVPFWLLDPKDDATAQRRDLLAARGIPPALTSLAAAASSFQPSDELVAAVNVALAVGAPLLLTGEPGTGKTQVAFYLAWYFGLEAEKSFFQMDVRSSSTAADLLYHFDTVAYFHAAHDPARSRTPIAQSEFVRPGPLWRALKTQGPTLVLIDEIDKASRDFPNDLLRVLADGSFSVPEMNIRIEREPHAPPPILVVTSNSERRLPEPFLRRCIFHHIELTDETLRRAIAARRRDFAALDDETVEAAVGRVIDIRARNIRKKPSTAELLVWLTVLNANGVATADALRAASLRDLPALSALIKDREDFAAL